MFLICISIVARAGLSTSDVCLEIGPGTGNLTVRLLEQSKKFIAVEFDRRMVREVLKRVEGRLMLLCMIFVHLFTKGNI